MASNVYDVADGAPRSPACARCVSAGPLLVRRDYLGIPIPVPVICVGCGRRLLSGSWTQTPALTAMAAALAEP